MCQQRTGCVSIVVLCIQFVQISGKYNCNLKATRRDFRQQVCYQSPCCTSKYIDCRKTYHLRNCAFPTSFTILHHCRKRKGSPTCIKRSGAVILALGLSRISIASQNYHKLIVCKNGVNFLMPSQQLFVLI